jgi:hypothetical protein
MPITIPSPYEGYSQEWVERCVAGPNMAIILTTIHSNSSELIIKSLTTLSLLSGKIKALPFNDN